MPKYNLPSAWNAGYAIPDYVNAEPPARGTFTTAWLPRGTIPEVLPPLLARREPRAALGSLSGSSLAGSTLAVSSLAGASLAGDSLGAQGRQASAPGVARYGADAARWVMTSIQRVPQPQRKVAMRALLDAIDPKLWTEVDRLSEEHRARGLPPAAALEQGLAQAMSKGVVEEIRAIGQRALGGDRAPVRARSQMGLGLVPGQCQWAEQYALQQLGFSLSDLNPVNAVKRAARAVASAAGAVARGTRNAAGAVWDGTKWVGDQIGDGAKAAASFVASGVKKLGSLACGLANSGGGQIAAFAAGGPAGAAGAAAVQGMCGGGAKPSSSSAAAASSPAAAAGGTPAWLLPAGIAAAGLGLILVLRK